MVGQGVCNKGHLWYLVATNEDKAIYYWTGRSGEAKALSLSSFHKNRTVQV